MPRVVEHAAKLAVVGVHELDAIAERREPLAAQSASASGSRSRPISRRRARFEQRARVPAEADRAVDEQAAARRLEQRERLGDHDRFVRRRRRHQIPNSDSARASSSVYGSRCSLATKRSWFHTSR